MMLFDYILYHMSLGYIKNNKVKDNDHMDFKILKSYSKS